jgi:predicted DNA-binding transcriptional regulator YafY
MSKSKRLIELMLAINSKKRFTVKEMADEFGVSVRTMHRDLLDLSELGMPLYSEFGPQGGFRLLKERVLPPIMFAESEAVAMFFAFQSLQYYAALPFEAEALSALNKFYHYLPSDTKLRIDELKDRVSFWTPMRTQGSPFLESILQASVDQKPVRVCYSSKSSDSTRVIQPIGIYANNGYWYCPSYCFQREAFLLFRVDRILSLEQVEPEHPTKDLKSFTITEWLKHPYGEAQESHKIPIKVRLTREGVRICSMFHGFSDDIQLQQDGSGMLQTLMHRENFSLFAHQFLGMGTDAVVEEPKEMIEWMRDKLQHLTQLYQS